MSENFRAMRSLALEASCGDEAAADFLVQVVSALHLWDDLVDKDKAVSDACIGRVFTDLLVNLPRNPFLRARANDLAPVMMVAIQNWRLATRCEREPSLGLPMEAVFVLRSAYVDLVVMVATICGGEAHGVEVARKVRMLAHREGFERYLLNLDAERAAREGV